MVTETVTKESLKAVEYFEAKLAFDSTPYALKAALEKGEKLQIIDLRTPELFAEGHVPGAVNVDIQQLEKYLPKLDPAATTVVYCYTLLCSLATNAALLLAKHGYKVKELAGGYSGWAEQSMPTEKGTKASSCATSEGHACG
jgi:rhodanese-related sulfurtransferase